MPMPYVIEIDAVNGPCYLCEDIGGDLGRTSLIEHADVFGNRKEAMDNLKAVQRMYPKRKFDIREVNLHKIDGAIIAPDITARSNQPCGSEACFHFIEPTGSCGKNRIGYLACMGEK
ncbi:MAG: hypothetical protein HQK65_14685 [Desulfamplus sp.]|nr:hypothetical protein [Desulfamplus sp.]